MRFRIAPVQLDAPSRGTQLRDSNECGSCAKQRLLAPRTNHRRRNRYSNVGARRGERMTLQQTRNPFPKSHYVEDTDTKRGVRGGGKRRHRSNEFNPSTLQQTFSSRKDISRSTPRRREIVSTAGEDGNAASNIKAQLANFPHVQTLSLTEHRLGRECKGNTLVEGLSRYDR